MRLRRALLYLAMFCLAAGAGLALYTHERRAYVDGLLFAAAQTGDEELARRALAQGANPWATSEHGGQRTALDFARSNGHERLALLIEEARSGTGR